MGISEDRGETPTSSLSISEQAPNLAAALNQAQVDIESEKSALARTLHDDLGGLLVGAVMDVGWSASRAGVPDDVREKLNRAQALLKAAIDLKREVIEGLRPTLLDNVGLFSALRWHMKARCEAAAIPYRMSFPPAEEALSPEVRTGVFRIFQEALKDVLSTYNGGDLSLQVERTGNTLHCHLIHQSAGPKGADAVPITSPETSMHHRAERVGGVMRWKKTASGCRMHLEVPTIH